MDVLAKRSVLLEQLAALDEPYGKAYVDAEVAGWTPSGRPAMESSRSTGTIPAQEARTAADHFPAPAG